MLLIIMSHLQLPLVAEHCLIHVSVNYNHPHQRNSNSNQSCYKLHHCNLTCVTNPPSANQPKDLLSCDIQGQSGLTWTEKLTCAENQRWKRRKETDSQTDSRCLTCGQQLHRQRRQRRRFPSQTQTPSTGCSLEDTTPPCGPPSGQLLGSHRPPGKALINETRLCYSLMALRGKSQSLTS